MVLGAAFWGRLRSSVHEVEADEAGEGERLKDGLQSRVGRLQQNVGDQCDEDLDADGIVRGPGEVADFQVLLDPLEEELDRKRDFRCALTAAAPRNAPRIGSEIRRS